MGAEGRRREGLHGEQEVHLGCLLKGDDLATAYGISGIPTLVVIGKDGKVVEIEVGLADPSGAGLRKMIDAALKR